MNFSTSPQTVEDELTQMLSMDFSLINTPLILIQKSLTTKTSAKSIAESVISLQKAIAVSGKNILKISRVVNIAGKTCSC